MLLITVSAWPDGRFTGICKGRSILWHRGCWKTFYLPLSSAQILCTVKYNTSTFLTCYQDCDVTYCNPLTSWVMSPTATHWHQRWCHTWWSHMTAHDLPDCHGNRPHQQGQPLIACQQTRYTYLKIHTQNTHNDTWLLSTFKTWFVYINLWCWYKLQQYCTSTGKQTNKQMLHCGPHQNIWKHQI